jgi:hypothetical protein
LYIKICRTIIGTDLYHPPKKGGNESVDGIRHDKWVDERSDNDSVDESRESSSLEVPKVVVETWQNRASKNRDHN